MNTNQRRRLEKAGWRVGTIQEFLNLSDADMNFIKVKVALAGHFRAMRRQRRLSQHAVARRLGSTQSRIAKLEAGDPSASLDLLVCALFALGVTRRELGGVIARAA